ncbi:helix-turn-helix transcriptional regulator [Chitinophaga barathri]|uniref:DNA-binding protein n=1 Tax=Chitinophaga barathri TaxID=1647451 RepID=A0A3N4MCL8_9BACT|nr:helix-turn-helix domain-containing protein [Chitinophaga barathri]RPD41288.1 DNA-binding protein [Chitinophaga barathri]
MSSNLRIKKVCEHCNEIFVAQKTTTKYCSLNCARRNYKLREKKERIKKATDGVKERLVQTSMREKPAEAAVSQEAGDLIDIKKLAEVTSISERTLFRLIKEPGFPKMKVGRSLLFHRETVVKYLVTKFSNV